MSRPPTAITLSDQERATLQAWRRAGAPRRYDVATERRVLDYVKQPPPPGHATWTGPSLAAKLPDLSTYQVWRILRRHGISLRRRRG